MLRRLLSSDGKEEQDYKVKSARNIASRKTILHIDKRMLRCLVTAYEFRNEVRIRAILKHANHSEAF